MKRRIFVIALIAFAAVTAAVGTAVASFTNDSANVADIEVYVLKFDNQPYNPTTNPLYYADTYSLTLGTSHTPNVNVTVSGSATTRKARDNSGAVIIVAAGQPTSLPSSLIIP